MESGPERSTCMGCGGEYPRAAMFGLPDDLRCPPCAEALRNRHHPAAVRRTASSIGRTSAGPDGRATAGVLAVMVVVFLAGVIESPLKRLLDRATYPEWHIKPDAAPQPTPPPGTGGGVEQDEPREADYAYRAALQAWARENLVDARRPAPWLLLLWVFIHGGIIHLLMNGLWLYQTGRFIEWGWGRVTYLVGLAASGTFSVAAGWLVNGAPTIGISGAIFAVIGWLIAQRRSHPVAMSMMTRSYLNSLLASIVLLVALTELGGMRISHVGHAAGFVWGLAAGLILNWRWRPVGWVLLAAATIAVVMLPSYVEPLGWDLTLFKRGT